MFQCRSVPKQTSREILNDSSFDCDWLYYLVGKTIVKECMVEQAFVGRDEPKNGCEGG